MKYFYFRPLMCAMIEWSSFTATEIDGYFVLALGYAKMQTTAGGGKYFRNLSHCVTLSSL
jgi:hypothetical protein